MAEIKITCPCCLDSKQCFEEKVDIENFSSFICFNCGFMSNTLYTNDSDALKKLKEKKLTKIYPGRTIEIVTKNNSNNLNALINLKYKITKKYKTFFKNKHEIQFIDQPKHCKSNFWLNTIRIKNLNISKRNKLLNILNYKDSMNCRPVWNLIHNLPMFRKCPKSNLSNAKKIEKEFITLPSSPIYGK